MEWQEVLPSDTNRLITRQRLLHASPDEVWRSLDSYGKYVGARSTLYHDQTMEEALLARQDPVVDLALARNASDHKVLVSLYQRAAEGTGEDNQDKAVRLACLSNRVATGMLFSFDTLPGIDAPELRRIAVEGDHDEVRTLFGNPGCRAVLRDLYGEKPPLSDLDPKRRLMLVRYSAGNTGVNFDDSDEHGPDMTRWAVHEGLAHLMRTAPLEPEWVRALHQVLAHADIGRLSPVKTETIARETVDRWKGIAVPKSFSSNAGEEESGDYTELPMAEELRCMLAVAYGRPFQDSKFVQLGSAQSDDVAWRCAYYGRTSLSTEQMRKGHERDGQTFAFAALLNDQMLLQRDRRELLESMLYGQMAHHLYRARCAQLKARYPNFDTAPVSDLVEEDPTAAVEAADAASVRALGQEISAVKASVESLWTKFFWGFVILGAILLWRH